MLENINLENILFLDIETVPQYATYESVPQEMQEMWDHKSQYLARGEELTSADLYPRAGIYAEFGKIICISFGFFTGYGANRSFRIKSFCGDEEKIVLKDFCDLLGSHFNKPGQLLCAHNGKEFDFPYLSRRILINGLKLPSHLDTAGKKPWEVSHLDTMELWRFGDYKSFTPLRLMAHIFNIPSPKDDIDGSQVWSVYWNEKNLQRIVTYCQKDVVTIAQLILRLKGEKLLDQDQVVIV